MGCHLPRGFCGINYKGDSLTKCPLLFCHSQDKRNADRPIYCLLQQTHQTLSILVPPPRYVDNPIITDMLTLPGQIPFHQMKKRVEEENHSQHILKKPYQVITSPDMSHKDEGYAQ